MCISPLRLQLAGGARAPLAVQVCGARVAGRRLHARAALLSTDSGLTTSAIYLLIDVEVVVSNLSLETELVHLPSLVHAVQIPTMCISVGIRPYFTS